MALDLLRWLAHTFSSDRPVIVDTSLILISLQRGDPRHRLRGQLRSDSGYNLTSGARQEVAMFLSLTWVATRIRMGSVGRLSAIKNIIPVGPRLDLFMMA